MVKYQVEYSIYVIEVSEEKESAEQKKYLRNNGFNSSKISETPSHRLKISTDTKMQRTPRRINSNTANKLSISYSNRREREREKIVKANRERVGKGVSLNAKEKGKNFRRLIIRNHERK